MTGVILIAYFTGVLLCSTRCFTGGFPHCAAVYISGGIFGI